MARFGDARAALAASPDEWAGVEGFEPGSGIRRSELEALRPLLEKDRAAADRCGARILTGADTDYPTSFRELPDPPPVLYVRGDLRARDAYAVAVVGSRLVSPYGREAAERLSRELAEAGVTVVSGLARGVDTAAHAAALAAGGRTIGVLGSGFARFYPRENRALGDRVAAHGAVITEFPPDAPPEPSHFPRRNRLIAALSLGVVVVEAREKSGALITARLAAEQGKDVFAVPGSIFAPGSRGPHALIKDGARPVESASDVIDNVRALAELARARPPARPAPDPAGLSPVERRALAALDGEVRGIDAVARRAELTPAETAAALLTLEIAGWARALPGRNYVRTERAIPAVP